jgi:hypothetical protein
MWRRLLLPLAAAAALIGCGQDEDLPAACTEGADAVQAALHDAPATVKVDGTTLLSDCLSSAPSGDQVQVVGAAFVESASSLSQRARKHPEGRAALELGYLVAAAHRGESNNNVHAELLRRLDQEATTVDTTSRAFRRGQRAGSAGG